MSNEAGLAAAGEIAASLQTFAARHLVHSLLAAEALGLAPTDLMCMCLLQLHGPATPGWLAEMTGLSTGAVTGVVDRLERGGYATRAQDPHDRRRVIVAPDLERFARDIQQHASARAPVTLAFLRGYPAAQLETVRRFTADLAAAPAPTEPTADYPRRSARSPA
jgi:DNA-binding MarR family transcriptional regulator